MRTLEEYKKELLKVLSKKDDKKPTDFQKSLINISSYLFIEKGRIAQIGETREWGGKKWIKVAPNKWKPKYESESRGAKQSIAITKKKIQNAKSIEELSQILLENKDRFSDENGKPIEIAKEILRAAKSSKKTLANSKNKTVANDKPVVDNDKTVIDNEKTIADDKTVEKTVDKKKGYIENGAIKKNGKTISKNYSEYKTAVKEAFNQEYKEDIQEYKDAKAEKEKNPEDEKALTRFKESFKQLLMDMAEFAFNLNEKFSDVLDIFRRKNEDEYDATIYKEIEKMQKLEKYHQDDSTEDLKNLFKTTKDKTLKRTIKTILRDREAA